MPPTPVQENVLNATKDLIGMGRVNTWSDAGDRQPPCDARRDQPSRSECAKDEKCPSYALYVPSLLFQFFGLQCGWCPSGGDQQRMGLSNYMRLQQLAW